MSRHIRTDDDLRDAVDAGDLEGVEWLDLSGTKITDAGLAHLKSLTNLQSLDIAYTKITDAGLVHLKSLTGLQSLGLGYTNITDAGLAHLAALTWLEWLNLGCTKVTEKGIARLRAALPETNFYIRGEKMKCRKIVTRHRGLVEYLKEKGLVSEDAKILQHAEADDVRDQHVAGVLPLHLAVLTTSYTEVSLDLPPEARGKELSVEEVGQYATNIIRYDFSRVVREIIG